MPRANIKSGLAFKASLRVAISFIFMVAVAGIILVIAVTNTLESELLAQSEEEIFLLERIYRAEGQAGLVSAIDSLSKHILPIVHASSVFDSDDLRLAGHLPSIPPTIGWQKIQISYAETKRTSGSFYLKRVDIDNLTLVVGQSSKIIDDARRWLIFWLVILGSALTIGTMVLGFLASRTSLRKLQSMESVMQKISHGDRITRLVISSDNDQIDRISAQVNWHLDRLSRLMDGMQSTASSIAHDLKTPLSNTQILLNQAFDKIDNGADPSEQISTAQGELEQLNSIVETILRISRIESSTGTSSYEDIDLSCFVREIVEFMEPMAEEAGQSIQIIAEADQRQLMHADASMIKQLLVNLIGNAVEHCPAGTLVVVGTEETKTGINLYVADNGLGISAEDRYRVLKPFERLDSARTTPGSGLGLALVAAIAERHGAHISLDDANPGLRVNVHFLPDSKFTH